MVRPGRRVEDRLEAGIDRQAQTDDRSPIRAVDAGEDVAGSGRRTLGRQDIPIPVARAVQSEQTLLRGFTTEPDGPAILRLAGLEVDLLRLRTRGDPGLGLRADHLEADGIQAEARSRCLKVDDDGPGEPKRAVIDVEVEAVFLHPGERFGSRHRAPALPLGAQ